jgi:hypothetical protein
MTETDMADDLSKEQIDVLMLLLKALAVRRSVGL